MQSVDVPGTNTSSILTLVAQHTAQVTGASGVAIAIGNAKAMCCCASVGDAPPVGVMAGPESGLSGICMRTSEIVQCDDTDSDPRVGKTAGQQLRSVLIVPIINRGSLQGMLQAVSSKPRAFDEDHRKLLCRMAARIAAMLGESALENLPPQAQQASTAKPSVAVKPKVADVSPPSPVIQPTARKESLPVTAPAEQFAPRSSSEDNPKAALSPAMRAAIIVAIVVAVVIGGYELTRIGGSSSNAAGNASAVEATAPPPDVTVEQSSLAVALERPAGQSAASLTPGKLLKEVEPVYPSSAHGAVVLNAVVHKDGTVAEVRLVRGPEELAGPAIDAVRHWVYEPYRIGSTPVDAESTITIKVTPRKSR